MDFTAPYIKLADLQPGDTVQLDSNFTCAKGTVTIQKDPWGEMFFPCDEGRHYISAQVNEAGYLVGITRPNAQIIPITQSESPTMNLNTDDANAVSRFFQSIADKVVLASTLPKEVEELRTAVESLKRDVEQYREHMARADEEISNLRRERQQLQDENANLRSVYETSRNDHAVAEQRWNSACSERDRWHDQFIGVSESLEVTKRERDDAQMRIMELEEALRSMTSHRDSISTQCDELSHRLSSIRSALA